MISISLDIKGRRSQIKRAIKTLISYLENLIESIIEYLKFNHFNDNI